MSKTSSASKIKLNSYDSLFGMNDAMTEAGNVRLVKLSELYPFPNHPFQVHLDVDFLDEWDCEKNKDIKPSEVTRCSGKKVWWKCPEGHSFRASISGRSQGNGCPYCAHKITVKGKTDLASVCPEAAEKWDYKKNYPILPQDVFPHTTNKYYWKCEKGHSWKCRPLFMINDNRCLSCHSRHIKYGQNDFASKYPELLKEWCYDLNQDINPCMLKSTSREKVWWECQNHHKWKATVVGRTTGHGCPMCSGHTLRWAVRT